MCSLPDGSISKNVIIFGDDMSSTVHIDHKKNIFWFLKKVQDKGKMILR